MHLKALSISLLLASLILLVGCGGGGGNQSGGQQDGTPNEAGKQNERAANKGSGVKIALGTIAVVKPDERKVVLRPSTEVQGGERMIFKIVDGAKISLDNQPADMADVKERQRAQITYIVRNGRNLARDVALISRS
jgi:hypothetical protein